MPQWPHPAQIVAAPPSAVIASLTHRTFVVVASLPRRPSVIPPLRAALSRSPRHPSPLEPIPPPVHRRTPHHSDQCRRRTPSSAHRPDRHSPSPHTLVLGQMGTTAVAVALIPPRPTRGPRHSQPCPRDPATKQWLEVAGELACHSSVMRLKLLGPSVLESGK
ncbi:hypothetical protein OsI_10463 [Oryza sativa Indica Group]|uniref:Os03g0207700 protein n=3 Tax=Oryza sativa TaxID=4530 RepID=A0A5S6R7Y6_ORYSJ|nr:expressed protein [Oryza sativa Japonica Group]EAY88978.1 hypothetical protein OsI_10463 [Oryza sativa Indica Group]BAF11241.2 Os03g0207700 [Oryza sativa Japonica Group]|eukprot:NP_001049327.2 Os03g0207700 [Oryza sativa Japonica Group]